MNWKSRATLSIGLFALTTLAALGCSRPVVPAHVRSRVAYGELNPAGTWVGPDGSMMVLSAPVGRHQLFTVESRSPRGTLAGEALVEGATVYVTRHDGAHANDLCLYLYERRDGHLEALWGSASGVAPIAYEEAHLAVSREGDWNGVYAEWGNNRGGRYEDRLIIGRALQGDPRIHRLHWTQGDHGWYRGTAFEFGDRLVAVRLPGVLVHTSSYVAGNYRVTERSTEVGQNVSWVLGAYHMEGDELVGVEATVGVPALAEVRWRRARTDSAAQPPAPLVESEPPSIEAAPTPIEPTLEPEPAIEPATEPAIEPATEPPSTTEAPGEGRSPAKRGAQSVVADAAASR